MIGQTIESRRPFPLGAVCWCLLGAGLGVLAAVTADLNWALASLLPWLIAPLLLRARPRPFRATFTDDALEVEDPPLALRYAELQGLLAGRRHPNPYRAGPRSYPIQVIHDGGVLRIPPRLNVPSDRVYGFLYNRFSSHGSREVHPALADYLRYKEREFGGDRAWSYRARRYRGLPRQYPRLKAFFLALFLASVVWLPVGILLIRSGEQTGALAGFGAVGLVVGGIFAPLLAFHSRVLWVPRALRQASLVITPDGLALAQADLQGEMKWGEVRDVQLKKRVTPPGYGVYAGQQIGPGIVLKVSGAAVIIFDIYDRPIPLIHQLICYYWRGEDVREGAGKVWQFDAARLDRAEAAPPGEKPRRGEGITADNGPPSAEPALPSPPTEVE